MGYSPRGCKESDTTEQLHFTSLHSTSVQNRASLVAQTVKNLPANAGEAGLILELGRFSGEGNGNPLQYSCLASPMDRGAWWATVHGAAKSQI